MSVIGRLDDQVDEVIIKPVSQRKGRERLESERESLKETAAEPQAEAELHVPEEQYKSKAHSSELPVWLL